MKNVSQKEISDYLDFLRTTGDVNMFGSVPYIQAVFGVDKAEAKAALKQWMDDFKEQ